MVEENKPVSDISKALVIIDLFPVLFAFTSLLIINLIYKDILFLIGSILVIIAGSSMIVYKLIIAFFDKEYPNIKKPMIICMPIGFLLFIISIIIKRKEIDFKKIWSRIIHKCLSLLFLILAFCGIICMIIFAIILDQTKSITNWVEEITNSFSQACFMIVAILYKCNLKEENNVDLTERKTEMTDIKCDN